MHTSTNYDLYMSVKKIKKGGSMKKILFFVVLLVIVFHLTTGYCSTSSEIGRQILSKVLQTDYKNIEFVKKHLQVLLSGKHIFLE